MDLARELVTLSGFRPGEDIEMIFTGPRPGEKLFEELSIAGENMQPTRHPKIVVWNNIPMDRDRLRTGMSDVVEVAKSQDHVRIVEKIRELVPEYRAENNSA